MGTTPCPASGVWIRAASAQLPLRWGRFFATYGNERGRQLRRPLLARNKQCQGRDNQNNKSR